MEETLTVLKLDLPPMLRRSLATINAIENTLGTVRRVSRNRVSRNVKRWRGGGMVRRWTAIGLVAAKGRFRRIKGHREMIALFAALLPKAIEQQVEVL